MSDTESINEEELSHESDEELDLLEKDDFDESDLELGDTDEVEGYSHAGLADAMKKILECNIPDDVKTPVLCRRKLKYAEIKESKQKEHIAKQMKIEKKEKLEFGHSEPEKLNSDMDLLLRKIATKGAVTLFTAISTFQKKRKLEEKEAHLKKIKKYRKKTLFEVLENTTKSLTQKSTTNTNKNETDFIPPIEQKKTNKWAAVDENLLANPTLRDWDQKQDSDEEWSDED
ncbi:hypothetical protein WA158_001353 [Blastocystis sp. Blastoise]